jgi:CRISPR/Cas system CMR-associated protein Cmr5 small subunit
MIFSTTGEKDNKYNMTKRLEELFDLASSVTDQEQNPLNLPLPDTTEEVTKEALSAIDKIENALPQVKGLESSDEEMDDLAKLATASYQELMDLGMQVDSRFSSEIFSVASSLLGHAITAKTAKVNKKLKMIDLQLKKAALDKKSIPKSEELNNTPLGEGKSLDRNELLRILNEKTDDE